MRKRNTKTTATFRHTQNTAAAAAAKHIESMKYFGYFVDDEKTTKILSMLMIYVW